MRSRIFPVADENPKTTLLLIDNFRYDQWRSISSLLRGYYDVVQDDFYCAILPTATQYARNAIFAGLMPLAIDKLMPNKWLNDNEEGGKNQYEEEFLRRLMQQNGKQWRFSFDKLVRPEAGPQAGGQHPEGLRRRLLGDRLQLPRHPLARPHRDGHHPRADRGRRGVPLADPLVVRALGPLHASSNCSPSGDTRWSSPPTTARSAWTTPIKRDGRPRDLAQPALQDGAQPLLQPARSLRNHAAGRHPAAVASTSRRATSSPTTPDFLVYNNDANRLHPLLPATRSSTAAFRWRR